MDFFSDRKLLLEDVKCFTNNFSIPVLFSQKKLDRQYETYEVTIRKRVEKKTYGLCRTFCSLAEALSYEAAIKSNYPEISKEPVFQAFFDGNPIPDGKRLWVAGIECTKDNITYQFNKARDACKYLDTTEQGISVARKYGRKTMGWTVREYTP